jgi:hypothetical protein
VAEVVEVDRRRRDHHAVGGRDRDLAARDAVGPRGDERPGRLDLDDQAGHVGGAGAARELAGRPEGADPGEPLAAGHGHARAYEIARRDAAPHPDVAVPGIMPP